MSAPWLDRLGMPGVLGIGLLLFALSFQLGGIEPAATALAHTRDEVARWQARLQPDVAPAAAAAARPAPLASLAAFPERMRALARLAAQHGIALDRASYRLRDEAGERRVEVTLPLAVDYPGLRRFLGELLAQEGAAALDELSLQRPRADEPRVEAIVRLSYPLAAAP